MIPPALRRALRARDHGCLFPGCTHTRYLHAHHIRHWAHGGPTSLDNLVTLCSHHHRLVHEGGYRVEPAGAAGVRFRRPSGQLISPAPPAARVRAPGLTEQNRSRGVRCDDRTCAPRSPGDRLDYQIAVTGLCAGALARAGALADTS